jgi:hypothetical protein
VKKFALAVILSLMPIGLSACGSHPQTQAYKAGWNWVHDGRSPYGANQYDRPNTCEEDYQTYPPGWNKDEWLSGCNDAESALSDAQANGNTSATIPRK